VSPAGTVKVLDFGLAKALEPTAGTASAADLRRSPTLMNSPTLTGAHGTQLGMILGTAAYMAPEQARGAAVDKRADIWAFGVVLYEMITGRKAFDGEDVSTILAAVIQAEPRWDDVPRQMQRLLKKCLEKDSRRRLRDIGDVWELLDDAPERTHSSPMPGRIGWIVAAAAAIVAAIALWAPWRTTAVPMDRQLVRLEVDLGSNVSLPVLTTPTPSSVAISRDGMRLAYVASVAGGQRKLLIRRLDQPGARELAGTETATSPFFSPDGQWVGFFDGSRISKVSVEGGAVVPMSTVGLFAGATWPADDYVIAGSGLGRGLFRIPVAGGPTVSIVEPGKGESFFTTPQLLPGGQAVLTTVYGTAPGIDRARVDVVSLSGGVRKTIARGGTSARYLSSGHIVYTNRNTMFAFPFDIETLEARGAAVPVLNDLAFDPAAGLAQFDVSVAGTLVYRVSSAVGFSTASLYWMDSTGKTEPLRLTPAVYINPRLSPDGKKVVMVVRDTASDVWVYDTERDVMTRLTFGEAAFVSPVWSPDGRYVVSGSVGDGIFWMRADGGTRPQSLLPVKTLSFGLSFSRDGKRLAFQGGPVSPQVWTVPIEMGDGVKAGTAERFRTTEFSDTSPAFSPDGRWLAYESNESGRVEVYVRAFPAPPSGQGGQWLISSGGGTAPTWSSNGHEVLYRAADQFMSVDYTVSGDSFVAAKPRVWLASLGGATSFDLAPDGKRLEVVMPTLEKGASRQEHTVMFLQNFFDELRRRVPVGK
jgi:Tol biopolymer transport system component